MDTTSITIIVTSIATVTAQILVFLRWYISISRKVDLNARVGRKERQELKKLLRAILREMGYSPPKRASSKSRTTKGAARRRAGKANL